MIVQATGAFVTDELITQRVVTSAGDRWTGPEEERMLIETITRFEPPHASAASNGVRTIRARNRIAQYLAPQPGQPGRREQRAVALAGLAEGRAVAIYDYEWELTPSHNTPKDSLNGDEAGRREAAEPARISPLLPGPSSAGSFLNTPTIETI